VIFWLPPQKTDPPPPCEVGFWGVWICQKSVFCVFLKNNTFLEEIKFYSKIKFPTKMVIWYFLVWHLNALTVRQSWYFTSRHPSCASMDCLLVLCVLQNEYCTLSRILHNLLPAKLFSFFITRTRLNNKSNAKFNFLLFHSAVKRPTSSVGQISSYEYYVIEEWNTVQMSLTRAR